MKSLHPHLKRPRVYYTIGFGWNTDYWYDKKTTKPIKKD
mgnify:CR=1 FL=1